MSWIEGLRSAERDELRAEVERQAGGTPAPVARLGSGLASPHAGGACGSGLAGGTVELSARVDLVIGPPAGDVASVAIVEVKSGARRIEHRADLHFYALIETLRSPAPPFVVATYYTRTGELDVDPVTEELLMGACQAHPVGSPAPGCGLARGDGRAVSASVPVARLRLTHVEVGRHDRSSSEPVTCCRSSVRRPDRRRRRGRRRRSGTGIDRTTIGIGRRRHGSRSATGLGGGPCRSSARPGTAPSRLAGPDGAVRLEAGLRPAIAGSGRVDACARRTLPVPRLEAVGPVADEAVAEWERDRVAHLPLGAVVRRAGARGPGHGAGRGGELGHVAVVVVRLGAFGHSRPQIGGADDQWICPAPRSRALKGRSELRVALGTGCTRRGEDGWPWCRSSGG